MALKLDNTNRAFLAKYKREVEEEEIEEEDDNYRGDENSPAFEDTTRGDYVRVKGLPPYPGNKDEIKLREWNLLYNRLHYAQNKTARLARDKQYCDTHKEQIREQARNYYHKYRAKLLSYSAIRDFDRRNDRLSTRLELVDYLGSRCVKCGFSDIRALCIDHISGGGTRDRLTRGANYYRYYLEHLEEAKDKLQVLCANCDRIKKYENKEQFVKYKELITTSW